MAGKNVFQIHITEITKQSTINIQFKHINKTDT